MDKKHLTNILAGDTLRSTQCITTREQRAALTWGHGVGIVFVYNLSIVVRLCRNTTASWSVQSHTTVRDGYTQIKLARHVPFHTSNYSQLKINIWVTQQVLLNKFPHCRTQRHMHFLVHTHSRSRTVNTHRNTSICARNSHSFSHSCVAHICLSSQSELSSTAGLLG